jgi:hypothetical protein
MNARHHEEQMAYDVCKEYKSSVADPARMVAKIESGQLTGNQTYTNKKQKAMDFVTKIADRTSSRQSF